MKIKEIRIYNDENSSDEEMMQYFMDEGKMTEQEARHYVSQRTAALCSSVSVESILSFSKLNQRGRK